MGTFSDEAIKKILLGRRVVSRVPFPLAPEDSGIEVGIRSLADREIDQARVDAQVYLEGACQRGGQQPMERVLRLDPELLDREQERQILALACVDPDAPAKPFFESVKQVRDLDSVVVRRVWELYLSHCDAVNPRRTLTEKQREELVDALKKEPDASAFLADLERDTLVSLLRTLASQPPT